MRIELTKKVLVGGGHIPSNVNDVVEVDDAEGNALIASGNARKTSKEVFAAPTNDYEHRAPAGTLDGNGEVYSGNGLRAPGVIDSGDAAAISGKATGPKSNK